MLSPEAFAVVVGKVPLVPIPDAVFVAEDDEGRSYDLRENGYPESRREPRAAEWLGVDLNPDLGW